MVNMNKELMIYIHKQSQTIMLKFETMIFKKVRFLVNIIFTQHVRDRSDINISTCWR